jgi:AraC-like DNA-binding protein
MNFDPALLDRRRARTPWHGGALMGAGWATFSGAVGGNREHAHHALQLVVHETGDVSVWIDGRGEVRAPAVLLDADVVHRLYPGPTHLLYLDRQSRAGRLLSPSCVAGTRGLTSFERRAVLDAWPSPTRLDLGPMLVALGLAPSAGSLASDQDDRVQGVLDSLMTRTDWDGTLTTLAAKAALSPSRFRHRVRELIGMPLRPYLRWLRLRRALMLAAGGVSLTRAAQDSGFADAAHLTRTMQRHFGVAPSDVVQALRRGA